MKKLAYYTAAGLFAHATQRRPLGTPIWKHDWDVCVILDSCRYDMLARAARLLPWLPSPSPMWSVGSITTEWLARTFPADCGHVRETTLVSATPHTQTVFRDQTLTTEEPPTPVPFPSADAARPEDFDALHEVWRTHTDPDLRAVRPRPITDHAIAAARDGAEKLVVHYLQPHEPFLDGPVRGDGVTERRNNIWDQLAAGTIDPVQIRRSAWLTLGEVLDDVELLCENVDGTVAITSDHGNAYGPWVTGHPFGCPLPAVRRVPWVTVEATDERTHDPDLSSGETPTDVDEQLRALGYA